MTDEMMNLRALVGKAPVADILREPIFCVNGGRKTSQMAAQKSTSSAGRI